MFRKEKLKEIWNQISYEIQNLFLKYPCTISVIILLTLLCAIFTDYSSELMTRYIMPFLGWIGVGFYVSESAFYKKKLAGILVSAVISVCLVCFHNRYYEMDYYYIPSDSWFSRINVAYIIVCLIFGIYYCYRRSGYLLPQYAIRVFSNLVKTHIIYSILTIGALIISTIIEELFFSNIFYINIIGRILILVIGLFYVPSCIYSFSETNSRADTFSKALVKYILFPMTMLIFGIIYLYVLKILILRDIPSNQIFAILSGLFILAMPTWTMLESLENENLWCRISRKLPIIFSPLILLQIYSVGVRIRQYGITPDRYMGIMWILLEIIYMIIYFRIHRYAGRIFGIIAGAVIISLLVPGVNMYSVSIFSQQRILSQYKKSTSLPEETKKKIYGAYEYLQGVQNSEKYIENQYTPEEIAEINGFYSAESDRYHSPEVTFGIDTSVNEFEVSKYSQMQVVEYDRNYNDPKPDLRELKLTRPESEDEIITVNLEDLFEGYIDYGLNNMGKDEYYVAIDSYYLEHNQISLDEGKVLFIRDFSIKYDKETEEVEDLNLTAYLFQ